MSTPAHEREPGMVFVRLSQAEVGEVDAQLRPSVEAIERVGGYLPAIERGMTLEEIREAIRQDVAQALSSKPRRRHGEPVPGVIWELQSASKRNKLRKGFERCLAYVEAGKAKIIGVFDADRLTRDPDFDNARIIGLGERKLLSVVASDSGDYHLSKRADRTKWRDQTNAARDYSERLTDKQTLWHKELAAKGGYAGTRRPFAYNRIPAEGKRGKPGYHPATLEINEDEAGEGRDAIKRILVDRWSLRRVALDWNARGITTTMRGPWRAETVRQWMVSACIVGWCEHCGEIVRDKNGDPLQAWPALITADEHDDLVDKLTNKLPPGVKNWSSRRTTHRTARTSLLAGSVDGRPFLVDENGRRMTGVRRRGEAYVTHSPPKGGGNFRIPRKLLEQLVLEATFAWIDTDDVRSALASAVEEDDRDGEDGRVRELRQRLREIKEDLARYEDDYRAKNLSGEQLRDFTHKAEMARAEANRELDELHEQRERRAGRRRAKVSERGEELRQLLGIAEHQDPGERGTLEGRFAAITTLFDQVIIHKARRVGNRSDPFRVEPIWAEGVPRREADAIWQRLAQQAWQASEKTYCPNGHPWDEENTRIDPKRGVRYCRTCKREQTRERREPRRAAHAEAKAAMKRVCAAADCDNELAPSRRTDAQFCSEACTLREWRRIRNG